MVAKKKEGIIVGVIYNEDVILQAKGKFIMMKVRKIKYHIF